MTDGLINYNLLPIYKMYITLIKDNNDNYIPNGLFTSPSDAVENVNKKFDDWKIYIVYPNSDKTELFKENSDYDFQQYRYS